MTLVRVQLRNDTADNWQTLNPLLRAGELGCETDTGKAKIGDGSRNYNSLPYVGGSFSSASPSTIGTSSVGTSTTVARSDHNHALPDAVSVTQVTASGATINGNLTVTGNLLGNAVHLHDIADVTGLSTALSGKADTSHNHTIGSLTDTPTTPTDSTERYLHWNGNALVWTSTSSLGGSGQTSISNEAIDDRVAALLQGGSGIDVVYDDAANTLTVSTDIEQYIPEPTVPETPEPNLPPAPPVSPMELTTDLPPSLTVGGEGFAVTVTVSGGTSPTFQWQKLNLTSTIYEDLAATSNITGVTTGTLSYAATDEVDNNTLLRCVITDGDNQIISGTMGVVWVSRTAPVPPLAVIFAADSLSTPNEIEVVEDSNGNYDVSSALSVTASGGAESYVYQWQAANVSGSVVSGFGRGTLWQNIPGATSTSLANISASNVIWLQHAADNPSLEDQIIFVRCRVTSVTDAFNQSGPQVVTNECRVVIKAPIAAVTVQPTDQAMSNTGTASFTCTYQGRAIADWEVQTNDGIVRDVAESNMESVISNGGNPETFTATLALADLKTNNIGNRFRLRFTSPDGSQNAFSNWANLTGTPVAITQEPPTTLNVIYGNAANVSFAFTPAGGATISWEERDDAYDTTVTTISGQTTTTLSLSSVTANKEVRARVTTAAGVSITTWCLIGVSVPSSNTGDPQFTQNLVGGAVYENGSYTDECTSNLLAGSAAIDHYAVLLVAYADGRKQVRPLANGVSTEFGPLKFFPANSGYQKYRVNTTLDGDCDVSIMTTTTPHAYSGTSGAVQATPWARIGNSGSRYFSQDALRPTINFPQSAKTHANAVFNGSLSYPFPLYGFAESQRVTINIQKQEPFYGPIEHAFWSPPQSYSFRGAANTSNVVVACPHIHPDSTYLRSTDQGRTWDSYFMPYSCQAYDVVFWNSKFYMLTCDPTNKITALVSSNGLSWTPTNWTFFARQNLTGTQGYNDNYETMFTPDTYDPTMPTKKAEDFRMSVVNGALYVTGFHWTSGYANFGHYGATYPKVVSVVWRLVSGGTWSRKELPAPTGVVTGPSNYLVAGDCYSTNGGSTWSRFPGGYSYPQYWNGRSGNNARFTGHLSNGNSGIAAASTYFGYRPSHGQNWQMRRVSPAPSATYFISQNRPDDRNHYHYTPTAANPGSRIASLDSYVSASGGQQGWRSFIGPPIGNYLYAMTGDLKLVRIDARYPTSPSGPETVVEFTDVANEVVDTKAFDFGQTSSSIYRGGYQYGTKDQLDDQYLNGTYSPNSGPLIFCKDRVLAMFRTYTGRPASTGRPGWGTAAAGFIRR
jgi:hypothetical protein